MSLIRKGGIKRRSPGRISKNLRLINFIAVIFLRRASRSRTCTSVLAARPISEHSIPATSTWKRLELTSITCSDNSVYGLALGAGTGIGAAIWAGHHGRTTSCSYLRPPAPERYGASRHWLGVAPLTASGQQNRLNADKEPDHSQSSMLLPLGDGKRRTPVAMMYVTSEGTRVEA